MGMTTAAQGKEDAARDLAEGWFSPEEYTPESLTRHLVSQTGCSAEYAAAYVATVFPQ